jgi:hypothetical protein
MAQIPRQTATLTCPNCGHQFTTPVHTIIDVSQDPTAKQRFLGGQLNVAVCPRCGAGGALNTPFVYHDPDKELLFAYTPPASAMSNAEQQRIIGSLVNTIMTSLPSDKRKGYLFQPRTFLSPETLMDEILTAEGVSKEQLESQRRKLRLLERLMGATSDDVIEVIARENEKDLDYEFFLLLNNIVQDARAQGNETQANRLQALRRKLLQYSDAAVEGDRATAVALSQDELLRRLQELDAEIEQKALVSAARPLLDYGFFQKLTGEIDKAEQSDDADRAAELSELRSNLLAWIDEVDAEAKAIWEKKGRLIEKALQSGDWRQVLEENWQEIDPIFLTILESNIQIAQEQGNEQAASTLQQLADLALIVAREHAPPEVQLLNRLLDADSSQERESLLDENSEQVTEDFLGLIDAVIQDLKAQGRQKGAAEIQSIRDQVAAMVGS